jgi:hypothetical protein
MDSTIEYALKYVSDPYMAEQRKNYWIRVVNQEISGLYSTKLNARGTLLQSQLKAAIVAGRHVK